jgi:excinuclease ABC subunit A
MSVDKKISIRGARVHNLKNLSVDIPHNQLVVISGLSGSGKSSLAFDTLFAEGQRRYIESLSSYARQFLGRLDKPEVDHIKGLSPAIAIQQKVISSNPRSTVGTTTEIYDFLKILFARIGKTIDPDTSLEVRKNTVSDVVDYLLSKDNGYRCYLSSPLFIQGQATSLKKLELLKQQGYSRTILNGEVQTIEAFLASPPKDLQDAELLIDRISISGEEEQKARLSDSVNLAFSEGLGTCIVTSADFKEKMVFSTSFESEGRVFQEPSVHFFTFNNPFGACKTCEGYGQIIGIDPQLVIPDGKLSVYDGAIAPWRSEGMSDYLHALLMHAKKFNFPIHRPVEQLKEEEIQVLWKGNGYFTGLSQFFTFIESQTYKIQYRVMLSRYRGKTSCPDCVGTRLRKDASYVKIGGKSIVELVLMPVTEVLEFFENLTLDERYKQVTQRIFPEIKNRLRFLCDVGLGYLTLNRSANTLSGGESQRIQLATSIGSALVGSLYILDEPSIGLHPKDTQRLIHVLQQLRDAGNSVIVVEHEEEIMQIADQLIDIGPKAGIFGGELVFQGTFNELISSGKGLTSDYLGGKRKIAIPQRRRKVKDKIRLENVRKNNLKDVSVAFPLNMLVAVTGVSGSGKSTLIKEILYELLNATLNAERTNQLGAQINGDISSLECVEMIDQNPIGKSSRSNPITYVKAFDDIRELYSRQPLSKQRGYKAGFFSFNVEGGRCEMCEGEGITRIGMQFMADVELTCENCQGSRYKEETKEITYRGKNISEVLEMDISTALSFFEGDMDRLSSKIADKIRPLVNVGLGYLKVGQSSSSMSGGEAQRIKLASFLSKGQSQKKTLFIFDEPTTGLHFYDIEKLLNSIQSLIDKGHSALVIEHNMDVVKCADWVIDLGPEGGEKGGEIVFCGTPEQLIEHPNNATAMYLKDKFSVKPKNS